MTQTRFVTMIGLSMFVGGIAVGETLGPQAAVAQAPSSVKPAYMVVSSRPVAASTTSTSSSRSRAADGDDR